MQDLENLIEGSTKHFNDKIDFVLHSIGMSINVRKGKHYTNLNHDLPIKIELVSLRLQIMEQFSWTK